MARHLVLAAALLLLLLVSLPLSRGVSCESFTSQAQCEGMMTSAGGCTWNGTGCFTDPSKILPQGMVAITSIGVEMPDFVDLNTPTSEVS